MIIIRVPLRITFVGDATDLPDFYHRYVGRVISTTIDKYIYLVINSSYHMNKCIIKYSISEDVSHARELKHDRFRTMLLELGIEKGIEIGTFSDIPAKVGLGSSSAFSVALIKGLNTYLGKNIDKETIAREACRLEIDLLGEPIGKQDQYAAAYGGLNLIRFDDNENVDVKPILLDFNKKNTLENHSMLFFTGMTRNVASVLTEQKSLIGDNFETYKKMSDSVPEFEEALFKSDIKKIAEMINREWGWKKSLASNVTNTKIDTLYDAALASGAWGGKVMGAGSGGCLFLIVPPENRDSVRKALCEIAQKEQLADFQEISIRFTQSGVDTLSNVCY